MSGEVAFLVAAACGLASIYFACYALARIPRDMREFSRLGNELKRESRVRGANPV